MRKSLLFLLTIVFVALIAGCRGGNSSSEASDTSEISSASVEESEENMKYVNDEHGYSIEIPAGFSQVYGQSSSGIVTFANTGCTIQIGVEAMQLEDGKSVTQLVNERFEEIKSGTSEDDAETEVKKLDSLSFVHKWRSEAGSCADIEIYKNGKLFRISIEGEGEISESFDKYIDILAKSLKMQ